MVFDETLVDLVAYTFAGVGAPLQTRFGVVVGYEAALIAFGCDVYGEQVYFVTAYGAYFCFEGGCADVVGA
jgi:hypothetical protein